MKEEKITRWWLGPIGDLQKISSLSIGPQIKAVNNYFSSLDREPSDIKFQFFGLRGYLICVETKDVELMVNALPSIPLNNISKDLIYRKRNVVGG